MSGDLSWLHNEASALTPKDRTWSASGQLDMCRCLDMVAREDQETISFLYLGPHIPSLPPLYPVYLFVSLGN